MDPRIALASAYLSLSIPFGPGSGPPPSLEFGFHPAIRVEGARGVATPVGYRHNDGYPEIHREEQAHIRQMEELGPAFWLAYALTWGEPFEPYRQRVGDYEIDFDRMWQPPSHPGHSRPFPQFRVSLGEDPSLEFLPGYGQTLAALLELIQ